MPITPDGKTGHRAAHTLGDRPWTRPLLAPASLRERFRSAARAHGPRPCLVEIGATGEAEHRLTYRDLLRLVEDRATRLRRSGVRDGWYVGVRASNTVAGVVDVLAVIEARAIAVIVDAAESPHRREQQFGLLCRAELDGADVLPREPALIPDDRDDHPTAFVLYTTGSTAASKAVAQSHYAVAVNVMATVAHHGMTAGEVMACALPISHVNGLHFGLLATLFSGGTCLLFQRFEPLTYTRVLARERACRATTVPSILQTLADLRRTPALPDLRYFVSAAAPLATGIAQAVLDRTGRMVVQGYGLSECMNFATTMPPTLTAETYRRHVLAADVPPVGHALDGCEISVRPLPDGPDRDVGEVWIRGHSIMTRYVGDDEATDDALGRGWLRTGDLGRLDPAADGEGDWLTLVGRIKNVAKCGGLSVSLEELDRWLGTCPGVRDVCCVARSDSRRGEAVTAFYTVRDTAAGFGDAAVAGHLGRLYDPDVIGLRVVAVDAIPRLRSGKPDRRALAARA